MFTGIVEEIGTVKSINKGRESYVFTIQASKVLEDVNLGDSIAVNGICLTVTTFDHDLFTVDVMPETVKHTTIQWIKIGSKVNLERAMKANGRFGGHILSGHIDGIGEIKTIRQVGNASLVEIEFPSFYEKYVYEKGSVAVDGTSLTVFKIHRNRLTLSLIPHTRTYSILGEKKIGELVNLEFDMLAKHVERLLQFHGKKQGVSMDVLMENGFY